jgi:hypothetical protein
VGCSCSAKNVTTRRPQKKERQHVDPESANKIGLEVERAARDMISIHIRHTRGDVTSALGVQLLIERFIRIPVWQRTLVYKIFNAHVKPKYWWDKEIEAEASDLNPYLEDL